VEVIEGSRIQNYRSRRDVAMERIGTDQKMRDGAPFTPLTVSDQVRTLYGDLLRDGRQIFENRGLVMRGSGQAPLETEFLLYQAENGSIRIEARLQKETLWLSLSQMADLFAIDKSGISRHLKNVFESGELDRSAVVAKYATTAADGKTYQVEHFNLDAIISVGYRVNSIRGTRFRMWATERIKEYIVKGFAMDDDRLKRGGGGAYFEELLARIRDIRSSEKVFLVFSKGGDAP